MEYFPHMWPKNNMTPACYYCTIKNNMKQVHNGKQHGRNNQQKLPQRTSVFLVDRALYPRIDNFLIGKTNFNQF